MESLINPYLLYACLALGAVGVAIALPRKAGGPQVLGGLMVAVFLGIIVLALAVTAGKARPNLFFYIFGVIALGASLRVITHPRPVYAALYFILTILSSAGLYLLLAAEFMTFALVIIYAGAILITYLFVIMLATEAPDAQAVEALKEYDTTSREPIISTAVGFALLATLSGLLATGVPTLQPPEARNPDEVLLRLPRKVERAFADVGLMEGALPLRAGGVGGRGAPGDAAHSLYWVSRPGSARMDWPTTGGRAMLRYPDGEAMLARIDAARAVARGEAAPAGVRPLSPEAMALVQPLMLQMGRWPLDNGRLDLAVEFPPGLAAENIEQVGFALLSQHPLAIELAGVILLLALVGAVILARKQVEAGEAAVAVAPAKLGRAA